MNQELTKKIKKCHEYEKYYKAIGQALAKHPYIGIGTDRIWGDARFYNISGRNESACSSDIYFEDDLPRGYEKITKKEFHEGLRALGILFHVKVGDIIKFNNDRGYDINVQIMDIDEDEEGVIAEDEYGNICSISFMDMRIPDSVHFPFPEITDERLINVFEKHVAKLRERQKEHKEMRIRMMTRRYNL